MSRPFRIYLSLSCKQFSTMSTQPNSTLDRTITFQDGEHEIILTMQKNRSNNKVVHVQNYWSKDTNNR